MKQIVSQHAKNWLTAALDPYHDVAVRLEGLPDSTVGRSFVRVHNAAETLSATADGDSIAVIFTGMHSAYSNTVVTYDRDILSPSTLDVRSVMCLRAPSGVEPSLTNAVAGTATVLQRDATATEPHMPSRLIGLAVEIHDVTAPLNKKGTITAVHCTGGWQHVDDVRFSSAVGDMHYFVERQDSTPAIPARHSDMAQYPGVYTGYSAKGIYLVARMSKAKHPVRLNGRPEQNIPHAFSINEVSGASPFPMTRLRRAAASISDLEGNMVSSGFQPFVIRLTGLPATGEYRYTMRAIVEYFPESDDLTSLGIATPSPPMCQEALEVYHQCMAEMPTAVPISMNAAGDYWRMVRSALQKYGPAALDAGAIFLGAAGQAPLAAVASGAAKALRAIPAQQSRDRKSVV